MIFEIIEKLFSTFWRLRKVSNSRSRDNLSFSRAFEIFTYVTHVSAITPAAHLRLRYCKYSRRNLKRRHVDWILTAAKYSPSFRRNIWPLKHTHTKLNSKHLVYYIDFRDQKSPLTGLFTIFSTSSLFKNVSISSSWLGLMSMSMHRDNSATL